MGEKRPPAWKRAEVPVRVKPMDIPYPVSFDLTPGGTETEEKIQKARRDAEAAGHLGVGQIVGDPRTTKEVLTTPLVEVGPGELPAEVSAEDLPSAMIPPTTDSSPDLHP